MNVTVADCLNLPTLREARVVAGEKGLHRAVSSVSVLELPDVHLLSDNVIIGNELIISALISIKDCVDKQCGLLRHLRSMGSACLVLFYVGVFIPKIDEAVLAVADELCFPLIVMPYGRMDFRYSDVITDVVEYIHTNRMQDDYYTTDIMNSIALLEPEQRNINTVLRLLSDRMRCTLLLSDRYLERKGAAAWPVSDQWDYQALLQTLQARKTQLQRQTSVVFEGRSFQLWDFPVPSKTHRGMHLFAWNSASQFGEETMRQAADVLALFLNIWDKGTYYDGTDALVEAILTDDPVKMRDLALQMGISIRAVHIMWVLQVTDAKSGQALTASQKLDIILKLKIYLQEYHKIVIVDEYDPHIIALTDDMLLEGSEKNLCALFVEKLQKEGYDVRCCIFEDLTATTQTRDAYTRMASCFSELCTIYPQRRVYDDSDVRFVHTCMECVRQGESSAASSLLPINKLKDAADGDLLIETLCAYLLDAESNTQRTGALLYLHKNTVLYRLNKIRSILKCDLVQMPATLGVYQAAAAYRILKHL